MADICDLLDGVKCSGEIEYRIIWIVTIWSRLRHEVAALHYQITSFPEETRFQATLTAVSARAGGEAVARAGARRDPRGPRVRDHGRRRRGAARIDPVHRAAALMEH